MQVCVANFRLVIPTVHRVDRLAEYFCAINPIDATGIQPNVVEVILHRQGAGIQNLLVTTSLALSARLVTDVGEQNFFRFVTPSVGYDRVGRRTVE